MKKTFVFLWCFCLSINLVGQNDTIRTNLTISKNSFSRLVNKYEKLFKDSAYEQLDEHDKISIIKIMNTISVYKELYSEKKFNAFFLKMLGDSWLLRIVRDLGAYIEVGDSPFNYRRYFFEKYRVYYGGPDLTTSAYKIAGLKPEHDDVQL